jgi:hypothetical protein
MEESVVHLVRGLKRGVIFSKSGPPSFIMLPDVLSDVTLRRMKEFITAAAVQGMSGFPPANAIRFKDYPEGTQL